MILEYGRVPKTACIDVKFLTRQELVSREAPMDFIHEPMIPSHEPPLTQLAAVLMAAYLYARLFCKKC